MSESSRAVRPASLRHHLRYAVYLVRHKWHVIVAGVRLGGIPVWRLITHDWSKFMPDEWTACVAWLHQDRSQDNLARFEVACRTHYRRNPHHWQYWMTANRQGAVVVDPMPEAHVREMVADWIGASKAQGNGRVDAWWKERQDGQIQLDYRTRELVGQLVEKAATEGIG